MPHLPTYQNADLSAIPGLGEIIDAKKSFSIESRATQEDRSNRLLNHLLARFGEVFSEYTAAVATACKANSGADYYTNYQEFLAAKAAFLKEVHHLGFSRGMAFDYTGGSAKKVWNTSNVAGVKKRVHRLLGLKGSWIQQSLLTKPAYRLDVVEVMGNRNAKQYQIVFKVLNENLPEEVAYRGTLLRSPKYNSRKTAQDRRDVLNADIWKPDFYKIDKHPRGNGQQTVFFTLEGKDELWGDPLEETAVNDLQQFIQSLVSFEPSNDKEGFHVLEHILLRPNDIDDQVLKISTGANPLYTPRDPYSNWITVIVPNWQEKFKRKSFQQHFEQIFRSETPAEMMLRFCWFDKETMRDFEERFKAWLEAKANCTPNECHITETANELIDWLNKTPCSCNCQHCCEEEQTCLECRECNQ